MDLILYLLLGHLTGDYALQSDPMAERKRRSIRVLSLHVLIYTVTIGLVLWAYGQVTGIYEFWSWGVVGLLVPLYVIHWGQDFVKGRYFASRQAYYSDQVLHILQLFIIRWLVV